MSAPSRREHHLDGLRGLAAVIVAIFHFGRAFTPQAMGRDTWANFTPLSVLWNGHFAVYVFFALSGMLFFGKFYQAAPSAGVQAGLKRYLRLSIPVLVVSLVAWVLHANGLFFNQAAGNVSGSDWLPRWFGFDQNLPFAVGEPLLWMYTDFSCNYTYNCNLWTIRYELFVVWLVIALAIGMRFVSPARQGTVLLVACAVLVFSSYAVAFITGAGVWLLRKMRPEAVPYWLSVPVLAASLCIGAMEAVLPRVGLLWALAAAGVIWGVDVIPKVRSFFGRNALLKLLGEWSFGMYVVHLVTLSSVASWVYLQTGSLAATFAAYVVSTALSAWAFSRLVDRPVMAFLGRWRPKAGAATLSP